VHHVGIGSCRGAAAAGFLPVGLFAQQGLAEPVEPRDHLVRRRGDRLPGPFAEFLELQRYPSLEVSDYSPSAASNRSSSLTASSSPARPG
jgi:hypothetical protein